MLVCVVMLQPFQYDPSEKNNHKFMVQSMPAETATIETLDQLVLIANFVELLSLLTSLCCSDWLLTLSLLSLLSPSFAVVLNHDSTLRTNIWYATGYAVCLLYYIIHWMFDVLVCPLSVTERFLLQPLVCGTVFHHMSLLPPLSIFCCRLKSHLFSLSYPAFWLSSHMYSGRTVTRHFGHYNRYYI